MPDLISLILQTGKLRPRRKSNLLRWSMLLLPSPSAADSHPVLPSLGPFTHIYRWAKKRLISLSTRLLALGGGCLLTAPGTNPRGNHDSRDGRPSFWKGRPGLPESLGDGGLLAWSGGVRIDPTCNIPQVQSIEVGSKARPNHEGVCCMHLYPGLRFRRFHFSTYQVPCII